jgi:hypothetical protein
MGALAAPNPWHLRAGGGAVHSITSRHGGQPGVGSGPPLKADVGGRRNHVGYGPCVDGSGLARRIFTSQHWSEQPCVRPVSAVHLTAGHNALRGSGPGQKHAFEDAVALVGCPDRRIDRHCITCCSPSQPLRDAGMPGAISFRPQARPAPCNFRPWPSLPRPSWRACWRVRWRQPWPVAAPAAS